MVVPNAEHMIEEIQANIQTGDSLKARLVLEHLDTVDKKTQNRLLYELSRGDVAFTVPLLNHLLTARPDLAAQLPIALPGRFVAACDAQGLLAALPPLSGLQEAAGNAPYPDKGSRAALRAFAQL